eukprot:jgi/Mesvir1/10178/Mv05153-RA.2
MALSDHLAPTLRARSKDFQETRALSPVRRLVRPPAILPPAPRVPGTCHPLPASPSNYFSTTSPHNHLSPVSHEVSGHFPESQAVLGGRAARDALLRYPRRVNDDALPSPEWGDAANAPGPGTPWASASQTSPSTASHLSTPSPQSSVSADGRASNGRASDGRASTGYPRSAEERSGRGGAAEGGEGLAQGRRRVSWHADAGSPLTTSAAQLTVRIWEKLQERYGSVTEAFKKLKGPSGLVTRSALEEFVQLRHIPCDAADLDQVVAAMGVGSGAAGSGGAGGAELSGFSDVFDRHRKGSTAEWAASVTEGLEHSSNITLLRKVRQTLATRGCSPHQLFQELDVDKDGQVSLDDAATALMRMEMPANEVDVVRAVRLFDTDGNRTVDYHEFCRMLREPEAFGAPEYHAFSKHSYTHRFGRPASQGGAEGPAPLSPSPRAMAQPVRKAGREISNLITSTYRSPKLAFRDFDEDKDGCISVDELRAKLRSKVSAKSLVAGADDVEAFVAYLAADKGYVDYSTFCDVVEECSRPAPAHMTRPRWLDLASAGRPATSSGLPSPVSERGDSDTCADDVTTGGGLSRCASVDSLPSLLAPARSLSLPRSHRSNASSSASDWQETRGLYNMLRSQQ